MAHVKTEIAFFKGFTIHSPRGWTLTLDTYGAWHAAQAAWSQIFHAKPSMKGHISSITQSATIPEKHLSTKMGASELNRHSTNLGWVFPAKILWILHFVQNDGVLFPGLRSETWGTRDLLLYGPIASLKSQRDAEPRLQPQPPGNRRRTSTSGLTPTNGSAT